MVSIDELRNRIRGAMTRWYCVREYELWSTHKGPCGAIAIAQMREGYGDTLIFCRSRQRGDKEWFNHWTVQRNGNIVDISGCYVCYCNPRPEYTDIEVVKNDGPTWCYSEKEIAFWQTIIQGEI